MKYDKINKLALKAIKIYSNENSNWHAYYHFLSGDELKNQVFTVAHKPLNWILSYNYTELSSAYKMYENQGIFELIKNDFNVSDKDLFECCDYAKQFLNDAKIEYTGKPFFNKEITIQEI